MVEASPLSVPGSTAVLLHPSTVPVIDVFRSLARLEDQYDLVLLDEPEEALAAYMPREAAKGIVSDMLLLAFALVRQRGGPFRHRPVRSRHGSMDEYCLLTLIGSFRIPTMDLALEAASTLGIEAMDFMPSLVEGVLRQIAQGSVAFAAPSLAEFRTLVGHGTDLADGSDAFSVNSGFKYRS